MRKPFQLNESFSLNFKIQLLVRKNKIYSRGRKEDIKHGKINRLRNPGLTNVLILTTVILRFKERQ